MNTETLAVIFVAVFGVFFSIIGWFIARTISNTREDIKALFKNDEVQKKCLSDLQLDIAKNYVTKDDCIQKEKEKTDMANRMTEYRQKFEKAHNNI